MIELEDIETIEDVKVKNMTELEDIETIEDVSFDKKLRRIVRAMVSQMDNEIVYLQDSISLFEKEKTIASLKAKLTELRKQRKIDKEGDNMIPIG